MSDAQRLSDELEISALAHATYAHAVDTKDWELYRSVFTDDAYIDTPRPESSQGHSTK